MANVRDFGARGDGRTDDTAALTHAVQQGDGPVVFPRGDYLLSEPLHVPLDQVGRLSIEGQDGVAKLIMAGPGPAIHLVGTHRRTAHPDQFAERVWQRERMPTIRGLEIVGRHPEADGIRIEGVMQPTLIGVLIRQCRHGIHITNRARNVLISDCHIYHNTGIGVFLDRVNLHQINIHGNHISYCKKGGIRVEGSEVRNIQICSNDIEYNFDLKAPTSADVLFDCRAGTIREGTIVGNTIQASLSPGGANVRLLGTQTDPNAVGLLAITGNLLGSQETVLHLSACRAVTVSGNAIYSGYHHALVAENSESLVFNGNTVDHNPEYKGNSTDCLILRNCRNVNLTGIIIQHTRPPAITPEATLELRDCRNVSVTGCQIVQARGRGVLVKGSALVRIADCSISGRGENAAYQCPIEVDGTSSNVMVSNNFLEKGAKGDLLMPKGVGVASGNVVV